MPEGVKWTHPQGGLFLWITLPAPLNSDQLFPVAVSEKVAFVPGSGFHPNGGGTNTMRINFSFPTPEQTNEGIARLSRVIRRHM
jgi:2-aminoadipate transaminase